MLMRIMVFLLISLISLTSFAITCPKGSELEGLKAGDQVSTYWSVTTSDPENPIPFVHFERTRSRLVTLNGDKKVGHFPSCEYTQDIGLRPIDPNSHVQLEGGYWEKATGLWFCDTGGQPSSCPFTLVE